MKFQDYKINTRFLIRIKKEARSLKILQMLIAEIFPAKANHQPIIRLSGLNQPTLVLILDNLNKMLQTSKPTRFRKSNGIERFYRFFSSPLNYRFTFHECHHAALPFSPPQPGSLHHQRVAYFPSDTFLVRMSLKIDTKENCHNYVFAARKFVAVAKIGSSKRKNSTRVTSNYG